MADSALYLHGLALGVAFAAASLFFSRLLRKDRKTVAPPLEAAAVSVDEAPRRSESDESFSALLAGAIDEARASAQLSVAQDDSDLLDLGSADEVSVHYEPQAEEEEPTAPGARIALVSGGDSDCGHRRKRNEDAFLALPDLGLFVVADGMGGYEGGQVASALAVEALRRTFEDEFSEEADVDAAVPRYGRKLASAVKRANKMIFDTARLEPALADMGTTLVSLSFSFKKQRLYVGSVGDSRCYRLRGPELRQLTTDHVMRAKGVEGPRANHLFRAVGVGPEVPLDLLVDKPLPGDVYLLCSDGLTKMVSDASIRDALLNEPEPEAAVYSLIEQANDAGGKDNVTVVLAKVFAPGSRVVEYASATSGGV